MLACIKKSASDAHIYVTNKYLFRRKHKKGVEEDVAKKRTRRTQKFQRAVVGASLTVSCS